MSITGVGQAISTSYLMFLVFAFLNAVGTSGVYPLAFVLGVEMVGKKKREMSGVILNYFYSVGQALVGIIALLDGSWVNLQYWVSVPPIIFIVYYWIIPESARWLLAKKRNRRAFKIIRKAAKTNGTQLSQNILDIFNSSSESEEDELRKGENEDSKNLTKASVYLELVKSKVMFRRSLIMFFIW
jgi:OCT family organic cation transporter-like MFS transporter 4/5